MSRLRNRKTLAALSVLIPILATWQVVAVKAAFTEEPFSLLEILLGPLDSTVNSGIEYFGELMVVTPTDLGVGDQFGRSAIISGTLLIVGSVLDDDKGINSGSVYVLDRDAGGANAWGQVKKLTASDGSSEANFSVGLALDGDTLAVGAHDDNTGLGSGSVYIYERNLGGRDNWGERIKIAPSDGSTNDRFGWDVHLDRDTLIIGAVWDDTVCSGIGCNSGSAYIFERDQDGPNNWGFVKKLVPSDLQSDDQFGRVVLISGDTIFITAGASDVTFYNRLGRIYVFERNEGGSNNWGQTGLISASDGFLNNNFGFSMRIFGDTLVVGARNDNEAATDAGALYLFDRDDGGAGNWVQTLKLLAPDAQAGDRLGSFVAIYGNTLVITASMEDETAADAGAAYVFSRPSQESNNWTFENKLVGSQVGVSDEFGVWSSIWDDLLVIGSHRGNFAGNESGEVYLFQRGVTPTATPTATATSHGRPTNTPFPSGTPGPTQTPGGGRQTNTPAPPTSTPGSGGQVHVGDLDGSSTPNGDTRWDATVEITVLDQNGVPVANTTVSGAWGGGVTGAGSCLTDESGKCTIMRLLIRNTTPSVIFTVTDLSAGGFAYDPGANTDPDGDSNGTVIVVNKP